MSQQSLHKFFPSRKNVSGERSAKRVKLSTEASAARVTSLALKSPVKGITDLALPKFYAASPKKTPSTSENSTTDLTRAPVRKRKRDVIESMELACGDGLGKVADRRFKTPVRKSLDFAAEKPFVIPH